MGDGQGEPQAVALKTTNLGFSVDVTSTKAVSVTACHQWDDTGKAMVVMVV